MLDISNFSNKQAFQSFKLCSPTLINSWSNFRVKFVRTHWKVPMSVFFFGKNLFRKRLEARPSAGKIMTAKRACCSRCDRFPGALHGRFLVGRSRESDTDAASTRHKQTRPHSPQTKRKPIRTLVPVVCSLHVIMSRRRLWSGPCTAISSVSNAYTRT